jgi:hypothetical protein
MYQHFVAVMSHLDLDIVLAFKMQDSMWPTPFSGEFLIFMEEAVFIKKYHLTFLKRVRDGVPVGKLCHLARGIFVGLPGDIFGQEEMACQVSIAGIAVELLAEVRTGESGWRASRPKVRKKGVLCVDLWKLVLQLNISQKRYCSQSRVFSSTTR